jgi:hypothetical protein
LIWRIKVVPICIIEVVPICRITICLDPKGGRLISKT